MVDPAFIDSCHERVRAIYRYWDGKRNGRLMPSRADLDPVDIPKLLPDAYLSGYHLAFLVGAILLAIGLVVTLIFINAKKEDVPTEGVVAAG